MNKSNINKYVYVQLNLNFNFYNLVTTIQGLYEYIIIHRVVQRKMGFSVVSLVFTFLYLHLSYLQSGLCVMAFCVLASLFDNFLRLA